MELISKLREKSRQSGPGGVFGSALRHVANRLDPAGAGKEVNEKKGDEFLLWVRFAVPGMLDSGNIEAMEHAISNMPKGSSVLEIGSFCGLSTVVISHLLEKYSNSSKLYTCDKWEFEGQQLGTLLGGSQSVTHDDYRAYVKGTFLRTMQTFAQGRLPFTIECFSDEMFRRWFTNEKSVDVFGRPATLGGKLGFCYIDGNHSYEFAKRDFENADRVLERHGFVLFDDSGDGSVWEVNQLAREIASGKKYTLVSHSPNYLFRKS